MDKFIKLTTTHRTPICINFDKVISFERGYQCTSIFFNMSDRIDVKETILEIENLIKKRAK